MLRLIVGAWLLLGSVAYAQDDPRLRCLQQLAAQAALELDAGREAGDDLATLMEGLNLDPSVCDEAVFGGEPRDYLLNEQDLPRWGFDGNFFDDGIEDPVLCLEEGVPPGSVNRNARFSQPGNIFIHAVILFPDTASAEAAMDVLYRGASSCGTFTNSGRTVTASTFEVEALGDEAFGFRVDVMDSAAAATYVRHANLITLTVYSRADGGPPDFDRLAELTAQANRHVLEVATYELLE